MIDYNKPWHELKVDLTNAMNPHFDAEKFRIDTGKGSDPVAMWSLKGKEMLQLLNEEWLDYLSSIGIPVDSLLIFYRDPHLVYPSAHVDILWHTDSPNIFALNWVFSPNDDSVMTWYDVPYETGISELTPVNTKYVYWNLEDIQDKEFARHTIGDKLTIVRTGIAHNVITNDQPRWVISLRSKVIGNPNYHDWNSAVDYFNTTLKLVKS
jgi:hypothetical protein